MLAKYEQVRITQSIGEFGYAGLEFRAELKAKKARAGRFYLQRSA